jgi:hypothetical protein
MAVAKNKNANETVMLNIIGHEKVASSTLLAVVKNTKIKSPKLLTKVAEMPVAKSEVLLEIANRDCINNETMAAVTSNTNVDYNTFIGLRENKLLQQTNLLERDPIREEDMAKQKIMKNLVDLNGLRPEVAQSPAVENAVKVEAKAVVKNSTAPVVDISDAEKADIEMVMRAANMIINQNNATTKAVSQLSTDTTGMPQAQKASFVSQLSSVKVESPQQNTAPALKMPNS